MADFYEPFPQLPFIDVPVWHKGKAVDKMDRGTALPALSASCMTLRASKNELTSSRVSRRIHFSSAFVLVPHENEILNGSCMSI
jgi:hypothetical protein